MLVKFVYFLCIFDPKNLSKISQKIVNFWAQFWIFLLGVLEVFGFLLGAFLGLLRLSWEASGPKNLQKRRFFEVFENAAFWFFEAPDGSFGLILALLGHSDPKMGSKMSFSLFRKSGKKNV